MVRKKLLIATIAFAALGAGWYAFRPERAFIDQVVNESMPSATSGVSTQVAEGRFHGVAHEGMGRASILRLPGGQRVLRLTEFTTSNGPDVRVLLVAANDAADSATISQLQTLELGSLKGNKGDQNYDIPADADLDQFHAVTIWCNRFGVNFATAPLIVTDAK